MMEKTAGKLVRGTTRLALGTGKLALNTGKFMFGAGRWTFRAGSLAYRVSKVLRGVYSFAGRGVLITGGSRGLGLVLARQFVAEGAKVAILSRNGAELERAAQDLRERGGPSAVVLPLRADVSDRGEVSAAVRKAAERLGRLDVIVNNAGVIQTGPFEHMTQADYEQAMAVHFFGPLYTTQAALPFLKKQRRARIVNIASIGGKLAVPHLLPYSASKFALVGLSAGLCSELARYGIAVTTVCPGLLRTGSHLNAQFKGQQQREYFWFAVSDSLPLLTLSAESAARQIIEACRNGEAELIIGTPYRLAARLFALLPGFTAKSLALMNRLLPRPTGAQGDKVLPGWQSQAATPSILTLLSDRAARRNNELGQTK